jgi:daunorubicin resistance ABC transporter ATP-binding subunit
MPYTVNARGITKTFGDRVVLDHVDLAVEAGSVLALLGPNGAGKTTLVRILATLVHPDAGTATVAGHDLLTDPLGVKRSIGLTGQYVAIDEVLTGRENLELVGLWYHLPRRVYRRRAQEVLDRMSLTDAADRPVRTYSGGMRRRLDIGASLIGEPPVLFLDEPTTGLDPRSRNDLWSFVRDLVAAGTTVLLTTQYMAEAEQLASAIVVIDHGRVIARGTPDELKRRAGRATLVARVTSLSDLGRAADLLGRVAGTTPRSDPGTGLVSVPAGDGTELLLTAGRQLQEAGIALDDLGIRQPTLDEVFLSLTGGGPPAVGAPAGARRAEAAS